MLEILIEASYVVQVSAFVVRDVGGRPPSNIVGRPIVLVKRNDSEPSIQYSAEVAAELSEEREFWLEQKEENARARAGGGRVVVQRRA